MSAARYLSATQFQYLGRQIVGQKAAGIFLVSVSFPEQLVMGVDNFYIIFLFCHDEILSGSAFSVKVYVFMEDLPV